ESRLFGLNPTAFHVTDLLLHTANAILLFLVLQSMSGAALSSAFVAAVFALHPLHVESVAWISERKDVLSTLFWMLTLWAYGRWVRSGVSGPSVVSRQSSVVGSTWSGVKSGWYWLALGFFVLGLMSKPMLVTWPFVMLLLDFWPFGRFTVYDLRFTIWRLVSEKIPFFVLSASSCVLTWAAQKGGGALMTEENLPTDLRFENAVVSYA